MATNIGFVDVGPPEMLSCKYCEYRDKDNAHKENADLFGVETKKMQTYLLEIRNMTCGYGKKNICRDLNIRLPQGSCSLILGNNGCGKSTLFSVITGMKKARNGQFFWKGSEIPVESMQNRIGYVPQQSPLISELTVWDNLMLWYGDKKRLQEELETGMLQKLGVNQMQKMQVSRLSGGMTRRCAIGCAMAGSPELLVLDEPGAALDMECKKIWKACMKEYVMQGGTVLFSTHDETDQDLADHIYYMKDGVLLEATS